MILGEYNIFSGIREDELSFIPRISSMNRNGLVSYMENYMVDGLNTLLLHGLVFFMSILVETLSSVEEGVGDTSSI